MPARTARTARSAAKPAAKPSGKNRAPRSSAKATADATVKTRTLTAKERKAGTAKLGKPTARRAAPKPSATADRKAGKRVADPKATTGGGALSAERVREIAKVGKLRAGGASWKEIGEATDYSQSALARMRLIGKREGIAGFTR